MSDIYSKVKSVPNICGIELAFSGGMKPSTMEGYQQFYNSFADGAEFTEIYTGKVSIGFDEENDITNAGYTWTQKIVFRFPTSDKQRAERLMLMLQVKFIKVKLTNNKHFVIGRNDFFQNSRMKVKVKSTEKLSQIEFESSSIAPTGYTPVLNRGGLPAFIPIDLINDN